MRIGFCTCFLHCQTVDKMHVAEKSNLAVIMLEICNKIILSIRNMVVALKTEINANANSQSKDRYLLMFNTRVAKIDFLFAFIFLKSRVEQQNNVSNLLNLIVKFE